MSPLVSVIVPSFNYGHFLAQTLASLQAQTHTGWECIVVDDGSTDNTWEVALAHARRDPRIKYVRRPNGGLPAARNSGLRVAAGEFVQFLDADDALEPRKLEAQVAYLEHSPHVGIVYGDVRYFDSETGAQRRGLFSDEPWMPETAGPGERVLRELIRANIMVVNAPLVRRAVVEQIGLFDESLTSLEDWEYWIRCAAAGVWFEYWPEAGTLSLVRVHRGSMSQDRSTMYRQQCRIRRSMEARLTGDEIHRLNQFWLAHELAHLGAGAVASGDRLFGARCLLEAAWTHPTAERRMWAKRGLRALLPF